MGITTDNGHKFRNDLVIVLTGVALMAVGVYTQIDSVATGAGAMLIGAGARGLILNE